MATNRMHEKKDEVYFITFTCTAWLNLFSITDTYEEFDKWFEYLRKNEVSVLGYVIMPNHFHGLLYIPEKCKPSLNQVVANGKRFLAYEIVKRLKEQSGHKILRHLAFKRTRTEESKGTQHKVFIRSFDAKLCFNREMAETKLDYIHHNPVAGKWELTEDWTQYRYSSAAYYMREEQHPYLKDYRDFI